MTAQSKQVLLIDDDTNLLAGLRRQLGQRFTIVTAEGGAEALDAMRSHGPFAVAVCDMRMPGADGIEILHEIQQGFPDTTRVMLTGNADQKTAIDAINKGRIFQFLNKPCSIEDLRDTIEAGIHQHQLIKAERAILEGTLSGSIALMSEILSLAAPESFERALRLRSWALRISEALQFQSTWELELAASLARIGEIALPQEVLARQRSGHPLSEVEQSMLATVPEIGAKLIRRIPRLETVADAVRYQAKWFERDDDAALPLSGKDIPFQARVLHLLLALEEAGSGRLTRRAFHAVAQFPGRFDPYVLQNAVTALKGMAEDEAEWSVLDVSATGLLPGDRLECDLTLVGGKLVLASGQLINDALFLKIKNLRTMYKFVEPIRVKRTSSFR